MEQAFDYLDAPVERVCGLDVPIPCAPEAIKVYPNADDVAAAVERTLGTRHERAPAPAPLDLHGGGRVTRWLVEDGTEVAPAGRRTVETDKAEAEIEATRPARSPVVARGGRGRAGRGVIAQIGGDGSRRRRPPTRSRATALDEHHRSPWR